MKYMALSNSIPREKTSYNVFYGTDEDYDSALTEEEVMAKLYEEYGYDYKALVPHTSIPILC